MATTNFFAQAIAIPFEGCLNMTIRKDGEQLTVSVLLANEGCGDTAKAHIPPLILKGNVKELGEGFFPAIAEPITQASALLVNMEQFLKGQENAKKHSAMEKKKEAKAEKPATPADPKEAKYANAMAKVDSLEAEGNFREAWMKVPQPAEFPEKAEELRKRRASLSAKFSPDLFGAEQPTEETEPNTKDDATDNDTAEGIPYEGERE